MKSKLNEHLEAELDISSLTTRLKEIIRKEVQKAAKELVEDILDKTVQTDMERLEKSMNVGISTFRQNRFTLFFIMQTDYTVSLQCICYYVNIKCFNGLFNMFNGDLKCLLY